MIKTSHRRVAAFSNFEGKLQDELGQKLLRAGFSPDWFSFQNFPGSGKLAANYCGGIIFSDLSVTHQQKRPELALGNANLPLSKITRQSADWTERFISAGMIPPPSLSREGEVLVWALHEREHNLRPWGWVRNQVGLYIPEGMKLETMEEFDRWIERKVAIPERCPQELLAWWKKKGKPMPPPPPPSSPTPVASPKPPEPVPAKDPVAEMKAEYDLLKAEYDQEVLANKQHLEHLEQARRAILELQGVRDSLVKQVTELDRKPNEGELRTVFEKGVAKGREDMAKERSEEIADLQEQLARLSKDLKENDELLLKGEQAISALEKETKAQKEEVVNLRASDLRRAQQLERMSGEWANYKLTADKAVQTLEKIRGLMK
jgi:hypothetical protein